MSRHRPWTVIVALLGLLVAGCGGGASGDSKDATAVLKDTFGGTKDVKSGKLNVAFKLESQGSKDLSGPVSVRLTGPFQSQGSNELPKFDFAVALSAAGSSFSAGAVSTGTKGFLKFQGEAYSVPANIFTAFKQGFERAQQSGGSSKDDTTLDKLGIRPLDWVKNAKHEGTEDVGGVETDHVSSEIDVPKLLEGVNQVVSKADQLGASGTLPDQLTPTERKQIEEGVKDAKFDVYSGKDDKILRKLDISLSFEVPESERAKAGGLKSGDVKITILIDGLNQAQTVTAPSGAKPLSDLIASLGGLGTALGGSGSGSGTSTTTVPGGGSGSSGSGSSGGSGANTADLQKYSTCLQKAGSDLTKAQDCAKLLTP